MSASRTIHPLSPEAFSESRPISFVRLATDAPRWLFLLSLVCAPWAYGGTRPWTIVLVHSLLGGVLLLWLHACLVNRRLPRLSWPLVVPALYLVIHGWWMTLNAGFAFDAESLTYIERARLISRAPGSVDFNRSLAVAAGMTTLLGIVLFVADLARDPLWRRRILLTLVLTGTSIATFGLIQRFAGAGAIFWQAEETGRSFFATYRYHSNASAFLNLVWPLAAAQLLISIRRGRPPLQQIAWGAALVVCLTGLAITGGRAGGVLAVVGVFVWVVWTIHQMRHDRLPGPGTPAIIVGAVLATLLVAAAAATVGLDVAVRRWDKVGQLFSWNNPRLVVDQVCFNMIAESGAWGFGPGTFRIAFPHFTNHLGNAVTGRWLEAHQDYLQTIIEWGYIGAAAFGAIIVGALWRARKSTETFTSTVLTLAAVTAIGLTLLHALVDFPLQIASIQLYFVTFLGLLWPRARASA